MSAFFLVVLCLFYLVLFEFSIVRFRSYFGILGVFNFDRFRVSILLFWCLLFIVQYSGSIRCLNSVVDLVKFDFKWLVFYVSVD
jgi:hypothetical protein